MIFIVAANVLVYQLQFYFLVNAFHPVGFVNGWAAVASILLAKSFVPISFGDLGVRESASVLLLGRLSVPQAAAFDASLLLFLINIMIPAIAGLYPILKNRSQIHQLEKEPSYD